MLEEPSFELSAPTETPDFKTGHTPLMLMQSLESLIGLGQKRTAMRARKIRWLKSHFNSNRLVAYSGKNKTFHATLSPESFSLFKKQASQATILFHRICYQFYMEIACLVVLSRFEEHNTESLPEELDRIRELAQQAFYDEPDTETTDSPPLSLIPQCTKKQRNHANRLAKDIPALINAIQPYLWQIKQHVWKISVENHRLFPRLLDKIDIAVQKKKLLRDTALFVLAKTHSLFLEKISASTLPSMEDIERIPGGLEFMRIKLIGRDKESVVLDAEEQGDKRILLNIKHPVAEGSTRREFSFDLGEAGTLDGIFNYGLHDFKLPRGHIKFGGFWLWHDPTKPRIHRNKQVGPFLLTIEWFRREYAAEANAALENAQAEENSPPS
jgi:hypothetical protein